MTAVSQAKADAAKAFSESSYTVRMGCMNCGWEGRRTIRRGLLVTEVGRCPTCDCKQVLTRKGGHRG